ncbi:MAG: helix-turn-helix domain-containing protein [Cetobacterium sp.]
MYISWGEKEFLLFRYLLKNPYIELKEVEKELPLSHMTIRVALENINDFFKKNKIEKIQLIKGKVYFPIESLNNFSTNCNFFSTNIERFDYLLIKFLFEKEVVLSKELEVLKVSRTTLESIIIKIDKFVKNSNLYIDSQLWSGFSLRGKLENKILLSIEFVASLFIFKELNPDFYRIFNIENSNIVYAELNKVILKEDKLLAENLTAEIFKVFGYENNMYFYNLTISFILVLKIFKNEIKESLDTELINKNFKKDKFKIGCNNLLIILEKSLDIKFATEYVEIFLIFLLNNNNNMIKFREQTLECIKELQNYFDIETSEELLKKFKQCFYIANYKKKFNLKIYNLKVEHFPINYQNILKIIKPIIIKYFENIFDEDILILIFELKEIFFNSNKLEKQVLLIYSTSVLDIFGELMKSKLKANYKVKEVDLKSISSIESWELIENTYDVVFFLSNYTLNIFNKNKNSLKIPYYSVFGGNFIKDPYFFVNYDIELKNGNI